MPTLPPKKWVRLFSSPIHAFRPDQQAHHECRVNLYRHQLVGAGPSSPLRLCALLHMRFCAPGLSCRQAQNFAGRPFQASTCNASPIAPRSSYLILRIQGVLIAASSSSQSSHTAPPHAPSQTSTSAAASPSAPRTRPSAHHCCASDRQTCPAARAWQSPSSRTCPRLVRGSF